jgi:hypothetical protein
MFCVIEHIPCECSIKADNMNIPPRLAHCRNTDAITRVFPVNLVLLQYFFDADKFHFIEPNSTFTKPVLISTPKLHIFEHNFTNIMSQEKQSHINFKYLAKQAKDGAKIYPSLADSLLENAWLPTNDESWFSYKHWISSLSLILSVLTGLCMCYMCYRIRTLTLTLAAITLTPISKAMSTTQVQRHFIWSIVSPTPPTQVAQYFTDYVYDPFVYISVLAIIMIIATVIYKTITKTKCHAMVHLELTTGQQCTDIPLLKLPLCPKFWNLHLGSQKMANNLTIKFQKGAFRLYMDWEDAKFVSANTKTTFEIPKVIRVTPWQAYRIHKIINKKFYAYLWLKHTGFAYSIETTSEANQLPVDHKVCIHLYINNNSNAKLHF